MLPDDEISIRLRKVTPEIMVVISCNVGCAGILHVAISFLSLLFDYCDYFILLHSNVK